MNNNKLVFIYDLDGTLVEGFIGDDCLWFADKGGGKENWYRLVDESKDINADPFLYYFKHLKNFIIENKPKGMSMDEFYKLNIKNAKVFPGVIEWFDEINKLGEKYGFQVEHFVVSAGVRGLVKALPFANKFTAIFATEFLLDQNGDPEWLSAYVSSTAKTEYVYRISKGSFENYELNKIFDKADKNTRYVKFDNMIYFGDGDTDVPAMKVIRRKGGKAIVVYSKNTKDLADKLIRENRADFIAPADYTVGSKAYKIVEKLIKEKSKELKKSK